MPITPENIQLARDFEPVLYFPVGESLLPADPKRYLEAASLWRVRPPAVTPDDWGEEAAGEWPKHPLARAGKVAGLASEATGDVRWLGDLLPAVASDEDRFLSLTGWVDGVQPGEGDESRFADVEAVKGRYETVLALGRSQPWYYAEILGPAELAELGNDPEALPSRAAVREVVAQLTDPTMILYHLFFPVHEEPLVGCRGDENAELFGTFAGEWACVVVLLQGGAPTHLGLSQRNVGARDPLDDDTRVAMKLTAWKDAPVATGFDNHPRIAVAAGTHSLYADLDSGSGAPPTSTSAWPDPSANSCGDVEEIEALHPPAPAPLVWEAPSLGEYLLKCCIPVIGWVWTAMELDMFNEPFGAEPPPIDAPTDSTPTQTDHGAVIAPPGYPEPAATFWPTDGIAYPADFATDAGRTYPFVVDRAAQVWWPRNDEQGFHGRWGPAVAGDPFGRRSGMRVPRFARLFLGELVLFRE